MKKAKIDVLDIADSFDEKPENTSDTHGLEIEEPQIDLQNESFLVTQQDEPEPKRWRFLTWKVVLLFGVPSLCLILIAAAVLVYFLYYEKKPVPATAKDPKGKQMVIANTGPVYMDNLSAVINDLSGKQRIVLFGLAMVPARGAGSNLAEGDQNMRMAASRIVSDMSFQDLTGERGREHVKRRIKAYVDGLKGSGVLENVWITSWIIL
jgi:flagellar basal body-associated protein FliL